MVLRVGADSVCNETSRGRTDKTCKLVDISAHFRLAVGAYLRHLCDRISTLRSTDAYHLALTRSYAAGVAVMAGYSHSRNLSFSG